jgi:hypothetical protein
MRHQYTLATPASMARFIAAAKPVAFCPTCGYSELVSRLERNRCRSCADVAAGRIQPSPRLQKAS